MSPVLAYDVVTPEPQKLAASICLRLLSPQSAISALSRCPELILANDLKGRM
jgi:hypothetical protein